MNQPAAPFLTIITPVYNRASLLGACYESLCRQTELDFEWIVVDDGSTDGSAELAEAFSSDRFPITVIRKENGGKHTAINAAIPRIRGDYVLFLDSDDTLTEDAAMQVRSAWAQHSADPTVGVLIFLRGTPGGDPFCTVADYGVPVDLLRYRRDRRISTDCCEVLRAELLRQYPFPEFAGERFLAECALWNRIARSHKCVYIDRIIYLCAFLEDGLTSAGRRLRIQCPRGGMFTSELRIHSNNSLPQRCKYAMLYCCYGFFAGLSPRLILTGEPGCLWLKALALAPGYALYLRWKKHHGTLA